jgi:hypothetical protein
MKLHLKKLETPSIFALSGRLCDLAKAIFAKSKIKFHKNVITAIFYSTPVYSL